MMLSSAAALLSATGVSALVPVLDKRQYFPANATDLKTITVSSQKDCLFTATDSSHRLLPMLPFVTRSLARPASVRPLLV